MFVRNGRISFFLMAEQYSAMYLRHFPFLFLFFLAASQCVKLPWLGIEHLPPTVKAQSLNHWTTRDVLMSHFLYPLICWHRFVTVSWLWWIMLPWTQGCRYLLRHWFCFLWIYTKKWDGWILYNNFIFKFLRRLQAVFHSGCTSLHSYQQCTSVRLGEWPDLIWFSKISGFPGVSGGKESAYQCRGHKGNP